MSPLVGLASAVETDKLDAVGVGMAKEGAPLSDAEPEEAGACGEWAGVAVSSGGKAFDRCKDAIFILAVEPA